MSRIYLRRGHWWMDYRDERGKRTREPALGPDGRRLASKSAAERALQRRLVDVHANKRDPWRRRGSDDTKLADFLKAHERDHVAHLADARTRRMQLAAWREHFGAGAMLSDVTRAEVERYVAARLLEVKPATVQREISALSRAMTSAVQRGLVPVNPCSGVKPPRFDNQRTRYLSPDEETALLSACERGPWWLVPLVLLALDAGGRAGECLSVEARDVDRAANLVTFRKTKARRIRHVPMTARLRDAMRRRFRRKMPWPTTITKTFYRARDRAKLGTDVTFHTLRHTFGTRLAARAPLPVVQQLMGHQSITMTMRYAHVADEQKRQAIADMEAAPTRHQVAPGAPKQEPESALSD